MTRKLKSKLWEKITEVACKITNSKTEKNTIMNLDKLFVLLDNYEKEFGETSESLATRADYLLIGAPYKSLELLHKAYNIANKLKDIKEEILIIESISTIYVEDLEEYNNGMRWLRLLKEKSKYVDDEYIKEVYEEIINKCNKIKNK